MGSHNSPADTEMYLALISAVYSDIASAHSVKLRESARDIEEIRRRVRCEGLSFLTMTLPRLGKALDRALSSDTLLQTSGFKLQPGSVVPKLFGCILNRVFDTCGAIREDASASALQDARQVLYLLYKLAIPYSKSKINEVLEAFSEVDASLCEPQGLPDQALVDFNLTKAQRFLTLVLCNFDHRDIIPKHGPGSVAGGEQVNEKSNFSTIYSQIERIYPFTGYYMFSPTHVCDQLDWLQSRRLLESGTAKVVLVPKDSRGPRLISKEPLEYQWIQQGILRKLVPFLEWNRYTHGHVNFTDQCINRKLALENSIDGPMVTMDMKDASDRVSLWLVERLFARCPLLDALLATRTPETMLPSGRRVVFRKYAPMGSALCFPIEALCFFALLASCISSRRCISVQKAARLVYVYGDDIVVPKEDYLGCVRFLEQVGLKVNLDKCCTGSTFRESCGMDAFRGVDVTPLKIRTLWSRRDRSAKELCSWVDYSNLLWSKGYLTAANFVQNLILRKYGKIPYRHHENDGYIGFFRSHVDAYLENVALGFYYRSNRHLQRLEIRAQRSVPTVKTAKPDPWRELTRRYCTGDTLSQYGTYTLVRRSRLERTWILTNR